MKPSLRENILIESTVVGNLRTSIVSLALTIALKGYASKTNNKNIKIIADLIHLLILLIVINNLHTLFQINKDNKSWQIYLYYTINFIFIGIIIYSYLYC